MRRVERLVGIFVAVAMLAMIGGFAYYLYSAAERKGWFVPKAPCYTYIHDATGFRAGDKVKMLGFDAGEITRVTAMPPTTDHPGQEVFVSFTIQGENIGYIWDTSFMRLSTADFLGKRSFELVPGHVAFNPVVHGKPHAAFEVGGKRRKHIKTMWNPYTTNYVAIPPGSNGYQIDTEESPTLMAQLEEVANKVKADLPNILGLTNAVAEALTKVSVLMSNLDSLATQARPVVTNAADITGNLRDPNGSLGNWLLPIPMRTQIELALTNANVALTNANAALGSANVTLTNTDARLDVLVVKLGESLDNIASLTSNLNAQVQANTNILSQISTIVTNTDSFIQGLKKHWLLRSAFKEPPAPKTGKPPARAPLPKGGGR